MIDGSYNGVIEQVYSRVGHMECNIAMVSYTNEFSISSLETIQRYSAGAEDIFFAWCDFEYGHLPGAYEPFLDTICNMYRKYVNGDFSQFLAECGVYKLHRPLLLGYYETGVCRREENILFKEVSYEKQCMTNAIASMLRRISQECPVVIVVNRFQRASSSTLALVNELIENPSANIGMVLGVNDNQASQETSVPIWDRIVEHLEDNSQIYNIGSSGQRRIDNADSVERCDDFAAELPRVQNMFDLLDYEQARGYCQMVEHKIRFEDVQIGEETKVRLWLLYAGTSLLLGELYKALELVAELEKLDIGNVVRLECAYLKATCYMYQGKLEEAGECARKARERAAAFHDEMQEFKFELLVIQAQMSGWYNIFFCVQDIPVDESLIGKLMKYNWQNHLAHIYVYAYDNDPEILAKANESEAKLVYFNKGIALAKEIGNAELVYDAYQKNIMMAATNGMNDIAILYQVRSSQFMQSHGDLYEGRSFSGLGYNLSAMGYNSQADLCYDRAKEIFYGLRLPEDIAEVYYNQALNNIMQDEFAKAEHNLHMAMKVIEKLHLNSLRVCNLSKLYALLALTCILQKDRFNCERYLSSCRQFLNYIIEKDKENKNKEIIHDYAKCDDDMFLYTFSLALLDETDGKEQAAYANMEKAEGYLRNAEGNQFFAYRIYRQRRMKLFQTLGYVQLYEAEKEALSQHIDEISRIAGSVSMDLLKGIDVGKQGCRISEDEIELLIKQEGVARDYQTLRGQMDYISVWQRQNDAGEGDISAVVKEAVSAFLNHFNLDRAVYIYYSHHRPNILYNDTGVDIDRKMIQMIERMVKDDPQGFAVSKIRESFFEHQDIISCFGLDDVCSFVAVPFVRNGKLTSVLLTYVRMKENWHGSIERYMLGDEDLHFYQLLFREMEYAIRRMEDDEQIRRMNGKLREAAVTDVLTGIYNRAGMYEEIHKPEKELQREDANHAVGLMFIDLDNFKHYNDTFGHDVGDIILQEVALLLKNVAAGRGFVSRYGGDEFIIILDTSDKDELEAIVKDIYAQIYATNGFQKQVENHLGHSVLIDAEYRITCSIGIAATANARGEEDINELIRRADDRLYSVKTAEKGTYAFI